jgi:transcriptional regulator
MQDVVESIGMSNKAPAKVDVLQGTLDLMVLQTLATLGPLHGYAIAARLEQVSQGALQLNMGTLYPGLMRLEQRGLLRGTWGVTDNNRRARFYAVTAAGRRRLDAERAAWARTASIMDTLLNDLG